MTFANPHFLWLLVVVPPALVLFFWWSARMRQRLMRQFIQARLLPGLIAGVSVRRQKMRAACLILAVGCLILALAQPRWGYDLEEVRQRGLDIVVAVDTSKSMLAEDITPNRLARAKLAALDLLRQAKSDRLGLVAFAGTAFLQCPLTVDDAVFRQSLEALDVNTIPEGGTALAQAIETALKAFKEGDNFKVLVLFTDGEDHDSGALEAAREAARAGLRIFTIGIGTADGEMIRIKGPDKQSDFVRDESGNVVKSHLNEPLLQQIADAASGFYLPLRGANTMDVLYQKGLTPLPKSESREKWVKRALERYHWPLAFAIVFLIFEILLPERRRESRKSAGPVSPELPLARAMLVLLLLTPLAASGSPSSGLREYNSGNYEQALKDYEQALQKRDGDPRLHFNAGAAAYRNGLFDQASAHFDKVLAAPDVNLQEQAYYNLGNTLYHLGEQNPDPAKKSENWRASLKQFESSLKLNPADADAKFNHEFVKQKLEELKQQQQQQQKQDQSQQDQDQQQQDQQQQSRQDQQSKNDQQQNQQSQQQQEQKQSEQQEQSEQQKQEQQQPKPSPEKKDQNQPEPQPAQKSPGEEKKKPEPGEPREQAQARPAGQMSPQEAQQLLDAQKNAELMLPVSRKDKPSDQQRTIKDW